MIFNNNPTMSAIPMAEGYDSSTGCAMALIESARSDYAMFEAMLKVEARAVQFEDADTNYVNEAEYMALQEAAASNIWRKIKELFSALVAKIKAIFNTFISKLMGLFAKDKTLVKKYRNLVLRKENIDNLEAKNYRVPKNGGPTADQSIFTIKNLSDMAGKWKEEAEDREKQFLQEIVPGCDVDDFEEKYMEKFFNDADDKKVSEIGGIAPIMTYLEGAAKVKSSIESKSKKMISNLAGLVRDADKEANNKAKEKPTDVEGIKTANQTYQTSQSYQTAMLLANRVYMNAVKLEYKQNKSLFMKAIAANDKKLKESADYLDAVQFVVEAEVTDVLDKAISGEDLSDVNVASKSVMDGGVSDDPDFLTYGDDCYTTHPQKRTVDGSVDTEINSKSESAFFGELLY